MIRKMKNSLDKSDASEALLTDLSKPSINFNFTLRFANCMSKGIKIYLALNFNEHVTVLSQNASKKLNILSTLTFLMTFNHRM